jgi:hypothetical protein
MVLYKYIRSDDEMNYTELAKNICNEMIKYKVKDESFNDVYNIILKKYCKCSSKDKNKILVKVVHFITINGYDIECIKPLKFKNYND